MAAMAQSWLHCICGGASTPSPSWSDISSQQTRTTSIADGSAVSMLVYSDPRIHVVRLLEKAFVGQRPASWGSLTSHEGPSPPTLRWDVGGKTVQEFTGLGDDSYDPHEGKYG